MNAGAADARAIELIEIDHAVSFANKREQKEKLEQEEAALRKTVEENPNSRRARLELAKFLFHQNEFSQAEELALSVLELDETNANAFCLLGRIHGFGKPQNVQQSEAYFKKALQADAQYAKAHYFYAYLLRSRLQRYKEAEEHYKSAMQLRPDDVTSYNDCAIMLVRQNRSNEAKRLYEKVLELQPDHAIAHFNLANLLRKDLKDYKAAESHFLVSIQRRPKFTAALNNYATMLHHQLKRYNDAEQYYIKALQIDSKYSRAHFNYANLCREHLKKYDFAQEHYLRAIMYDSSNPNFYNNYGLLLQYALRKYRKAKKQYEIALKLDDSHALGHCNYATILMQMVDKKYNKYYNEKCDQFDDNSDDEDDVDPYFEDNDDDNDEEANASNGAVHKSAIMKGEYDDFVLNGGYKKRQKKRSADDGDQDDEDQKRNADEDDDSLDEERLNVYSKRFTSKKKEYFTKSEWHFKKSIALNRSLVMAYNNYGCLLRRLEKHSEAKQMFAKALSIDPKFVMAKRNLDRAEQKEKGIDVYNQEHKDRGKAHRNNTANINTRNVTDDVYANQKMNDGGCIVM
mmetsp:Transcript_39230/g.62671  ORF Transcript_39230/g.62671 Transcript_39230/m.62671 type:complete len:572 (-) Transcript_39230:334-2049(-)